MQKKSILVIEDTYDIREVIKDILEMENFIVYAADNGITGFEMLTSHNPDMIICDIMMPGMNGIEVFNKTRENEHLRNIPFVFISSLSKNSEFISMKAMGFEPDDFLEKPFTSRQLLNCVKANLH